MLNFKIVDPDGRFLNHSENAPKAKLNGEFVNTHEMLARYIWAKFKKWADVKTLNEWLEARAEGYNENLPEGQEPYTAENIDYSEAFDCINSNFILNIDGNAVNLYHFLTSNLPDDKIK